MSDRPILYSFRRCPYAMRARMALLLSGQSVRLREIVLREKPAEMLSASPKGSVPVLVMPNGQVIDESIDIMLWALGQADQAAILGDAKELSEMAQLIARNDGPFKYHLDRFKYANRYKDVDADEHRQAGHEFLEVLEGRLQAHGQLFCARPMLADYAIFPFVRQFRIADKDGFDRQNWPALHAWLAEHLASEIFQTTMQKHRPWLQSGEEVAFGKP